MTLPQKDSRVKMAAARNTLESMVAAKNNLESALRPPEVLLSLSTSFRGVNDSSPRMDRISIDAGLSDEDIPLADLRCTGSPISNFDDSYADPEYKPGQCEVKRGREEVWAVYENCLMLVCYDHCIKDIDSCEQHGKTMKKRDNSKKR
ncbi:hypothetical protein PoB_002400200 [Plakobranchus ocellatus]|uniref:Uncharacterized protein n=1 Tax=Plakobranchus ocellatus TaxID=259542 RepID=A0AAV3ZS61_9GAST|nr:hypothetical protein PoB_002400200 [Plakobranchus ocellatus]